jgi:hydroxyacyl-ACP dehydratase HTD2-like protein with hotdog domain
MKGRTLWTETGAWEKSNVRALRQALQSHLSLPPLATPYEVPPGYHQVCFNQLAPEIELSDDGAEQRHAPSQAWAFRVWAGGSMKFHTRTVRGEHPRGKRVGPKAAIAKEKISDARLIGNLDDPNAKVMVTLDKTLGVPLAETKPVPDPGHGAGEGDRLYITEEKRLCFMREIPASLRSTSPSRKIAFRNDAQYSQIMVPSPTLLFRFSALTQNSHAIHLDTEYTRMVYGLPKLIVQGPLTSVLMLDVLRQALAFQAPYLTIRSFEYRNLLPLFVNEPITISCSKSHPLKPLGIAYPEISGRLWEKWDVWISKSSGDGATMAVRGSAILSPRYERRFKKRQNTIDGNFIDQDDDPSTVVPKDHAD